MEVLVSKEKEDLINLFAVNVDSGENDGKEFIKRQINKDLIDKLEECDKQIKSKAEKAVMPPTINVISVALIMLAVVFISLLITSFLTIDPEVFKNGGIFYFLIIMAIVFLGLGIGIRLFYKGKQKDLIEDETFRNMLNEGENVIQQCMYELNVPEDTFGVDIFGYFYTIKDDKKVNMIKTKVVVSDPFSNLEIGVFLEDNKLCFSDASKIFAIPLDNLTFTKIEKTAFFFGWNKQVGFKDKQLKEYKMSVITDGSIKVPYYYSLSFMQGDKKYGIYFPPYEFEYLSNMISASVNKGVKE